MRDGRRADEAERCGSFCFEKGLERLNPGCYSHRVSVWLRSTIDDSDAVMDSEAAILVGRRVGSVLYVLVRSLLASAAGGGVRHLVRYA